VNQKRRSWSIFKIQQAYPTVDLQRAHHTLDISLHYRYFMSDNSWYLYTGPWPAVELTWKASLATDQEGLHFYVDSNFHRPTSETRGRLREGVKRT